ncbi:hypothetical protein PG993_000860 [Apiospora rasikravindrae]|uniref:Glycine rich protein n=1 Tax=Apiospora rasikravindrae TaxID=990691 RepID=A0ABR1U9S6_9PEZI
MNKFLLAALLLSVNARALAVPATDNDALIQYRHEPIYQRQDGNTGNSVVQAAAQDDTVQNAAVQDGEPGPGPSNPIDATILFLVMVTDMHRVSEGGKDGKGGDAGHSGGNHGGGNHGHGGGNSGHDGNRGHGGGNSGHDGGKGNGGGGSGSGRGGGDRGQGGGNGGKGRGGAGGGGGYGHY